VPSDPKGGAAAQLAALATGPDIEVFKTPGGVDAEGYISFPVGDHRETWPLDGKGFQHWLGRRYYQVHGRVPSSQALAEARRFLAGRALYEGPQHAIHVRVAKYGGRIYLDLADEAWRAAEIGADGWRVVNNPPVKFVRRSGMLPLPAPAPGGNLTRLQELVNLPDDDAWMLYVAWILAALRPGLPFPVLVLNGEYGSGKSTASRIARRLVDPNEAELRRPPRTDRDLMVAAANSWVVGFDNLSGVRQDLSDAICSLATRGGFGTRKLYTDDGEKLFDATRPVLLNGIEATATRSDLLDRAIVLVLPAITEGQRRDEEGLWRAFEAERPLILGALLDAVVTGLRRLPGVRLRETPRMADFARWAAACCPALGWKEEQILGAYARNREAGDVAALESSPVAACLLELVGPSGFRGTVGDLLRFMETAYPNERNAANWPRTPRKLSSDLRRLAPSLRSFGIDVEFTDDFTRHGYLVRIRRREGA
jgi:hypothetical protein